MTTTPHRRSALDTAVNDAFDDVDLTLTERYGSAKHPERPVEGTGSAAGRCDGRRARKAVRGARGRREHPRPSLRVPPDDRYGRSQAAGSRAGPAVSRTRGPGRRHRRGAGRTGCDPGNVDVPAGREVRRALLDGVPRRRTVHPGSARRRRQAPVRSRDEAARTVPPLSPLLNVPGPGGRPASGFMRVLRPWAVRTPD